MKTQIVFFAYLIICIPLFSFSESEPNNDYTTANVLLINSADSGYLNQNFDGADYWMITIPSDGRLVINTTSTVNVDVDLNLYDQDGGTWIAGCDTLWGIHEATHCNNLLAGTYYVSATCYWGGDPYSICCWFFPADPTIELENNDAFPGANPLTLNFGSTGKLGYYGNNYTDVSDFWEISIPCDGWLEVNTSSDTTLDVNLELYDSTGIYELANAAGTGTHEAIHYDNLGAGKYYILAYTSGWYGNYTITCTFDTAALANDPENNDSVEVSVPLPLNGNSTGHLGYLTFEQTDQNDWYSITVPEDGKLEVSTLSDTTLNVDLYLYDVNGIIVIAGSDVWTGNYESTHFNNLMPGTYYVQANGINGFGSYTISSEFNPATLTNDTEINDSMEVAVVLPLNGSSSGHLGFYSDGYTDLEDWWKVTIPSNGENLIINTVSDTSLNLDLYLYDSTGALISASDTIFGQNEATHYNNIPTGTYYVQAVVNAGYGSYSVSSALTPYVGDHSYATLANDLFIYPNPADDVFTLNMSIEKFADYEIRIFNTMGEIVKREILRSSQQQLSAHGFSSGIYMIEIKSSSNSIWQKLIIQK